MPAVGTQHVNILPPSLLGRRAHLGRALGRRRSITKAFLRDGSKDSLGFGGLWQTAWGPLKAPTQRGGERESNLVAKGGYLYSVKRGRVDLKSISILCFSSLLWGFQVTVDGKAGPQDHVLLAVGILAIIMCAVSEESYLTMPSNSTIYCRVKGYRKLII